MPKRLPEYSKVVGQQLSSPKQLDLATKIQAIEKAPIAEMRRIWVAELGTEPPDIRAYETLRRILAWNVQAKYLGGLSQTAHQHLDRLVAAIDRDPKGKSAVLRLKPGMVLVRTWKGVKHQVLIKPDGFEHTGRSFQSLSEVARHITGTRWSGPLFFGLKKSQTKQRKNP